MMKIIQQWKLSYRVELALFITVEVLLAVLIALSVSAS